MQSIFIWKADTDNTSNETIKIHTGSNWCLEDSSHLSHSYVYYDQEVIHNENPATQVITYYTKKMPQDWVGSHYFETITVPYELIKSDEYGRLEKIGNWMRVILNSDIEFEKNSITAEFMNIQKWVSADEMKTDI
jgi:hypothetical protein